MRLLKKLELFLQPAKVSCDRLTELEEMDVVLRDTPGIDGVLEQILRDVNGRVERTTGRDGVTAEQILKLGILRRHHGLAYRELACATSASQSMRYGESLGSLRPRFTWELSPTTSPCSYA